MSGKNVAATTLSRGKPHGKVAVSLTQREKSAISKLVSITSPTNARGKSGQKQKKSSSHTKKKKIPAARPKTTSCVKWHREKFDTEGATLGIMGGKHGHSREPHSEISKIHGFLSQKNIKSLLRQTNYNRRELYVMWCRFKALCALSPTPWGIDKATFKKGVARLAVEDDLFVNRVYDLVDEDQSDSIEWDEFLAAMSALEKGARKQKLSFLSRVYDLDGDGYISQEDLSKAFLSSIYLVEDETTKDLVSAFVRRVFKILTGDEDTAKISEKELLFHVNRQNINEDIWTFFGRSMLRDFGRR